MLGRVINESLAKRTFTLDKPIYAHGIRQIKENYEEGILDPMHCDNGTVRPLSFRESLELWINGCEFYEPESIILPFLPCPKEAYSTCSGIAYKANYGKIKIIPKSQELINIPQDFNEEYIKVDYDFLDGIEIKLINNECMTREKALEHPLGLALVEDDKDMLKRYIEMVLKTAYNPGKDKKYIETSIMRKEKIYEDRLYPLALAGGRPSFISFFNVKQLCDRSNFIVVKK